MADWVSGALLDTSVLIAGPKELGGLPPTAAISVVSVGELHAGVLLAHDATRVARRARLDAIRAAYAALPVDGAVAEHYGGILALARSQGRTAKATDLLIIATAAAGDRALHTRDERQASLARLAGVSVHVA